MPPIYLRTTLSSFYMAAFLADRPVNHEAPKTISNDDAPTAIVACSLSADDSLVLPKSDGAPVAGVRSVVKATCPQYLVQTDVVAPVPPGASAGMPEEGISLGGCLKFAHETRVAKPARSVEKALAIAVSLTNR